MPHINALGQCRGIKIAAGEWSGCRGWADCPSCGGELPGNCPQTKAIIEMSSTSDRNSARAPVRTIWKYSLQIADVQSISMPRGAEIISVATQRGVPCLWALVSPDAPREPRRIITYGTGHPVHETFNLAVRHVGTYQIEGDAIVFHVFDGGRE